MGCENMKKQFFLFMLLLAFTYVGCGGETSNYPDEQKTIECKIVFEENGGTEVNDFEKKSGSEVILPIVFKDGYNFLGWYKDNEFTQKVEDRVFVENDLTLYAKWEIIKLTINFENCELENIIVEYNSKLPELNPHKEGYTFKGWYLDDEYINQYNCDTNIKEDYILYAKWEINTYKIEFENIDQEDMEIEYGSKLPLINISEKEGYTFKGLYLDEGYNISWDIENDIVIQNIKLYAKYEVNKYVIEFVDVDLEDIIVEYNGLIPEPNNFEKEGYNFLGWYTDEKFEHEWNFKKDKVQKNIMLYPKFVAKLFVIRFEGLEYFFSPYGSLLERPSESSNSEKALVGWYKDSDLTIPWDFDKDTVKGDTYLYPKYVPYYSVTFKIEGIAIQKIRQGAQCPTPKTPIKSGYIFGGWFKDEALTDEWIFSKNRVVEDTILYPGWKKIIEGENGLIYLQNVAEKTCVVYEYNGASDEVVIPKSYNGITIVGIAHTAFSNNSKLKSISIPNTITTIENDPFGNCIMLEKIDVAADNSNYKTEDGTLYTKDGKRLIRYSASKFNTKFDIPSGVEVIEDYAFRGHIYLTTINIPLSVYKIGRGAFFDCTSLKNIILPNGITTIEIGLFSGCESLEHINIPQSVTAIRKSAFRGCANLTDVVIPSSVIKIEENVFDGCILLEKIEVAQDNPNYKSIDDVLYSKDGSILVKYATNKKEKEYKVLEGVKVIESFAFQNAASLEKIDLPEGVIEIKIGAFSDCTSLIEIVLPNTVTDVGMSIFNKCMSLTSVKLSDNMAKIETHMFTDCSSLKKITIPESVTHIDDCAFNMCSVLTSIYIPENVIKVGKNIFLGCDILTIECEASSKPNGWSSNWNPSNIYVLWGVEK